MLLGGGANRATHRRAALTLAFLSADVPGLVALSLSVVVPLVRPVVYVSALLEALDTVLLETETAAEVLLVPLALSRAGFVPKRNYSFSVRCLHEQSTPLPAAWLSSSTLQPCCAAGAAGSAGFGADEDEGAAGGAAGATGTSSRAAGGPSDAAPPARGAAAGEAEASACTCGEERPIFAELFQRVAEQAEAPAAALAAAFNRGGEAAAGETLLLLSDLAEPQPGAWASLQAVLAQHVTLALTPTLALALALTLTLGLALALTLTLTLTLTLSRPCSRGT